MLIFVLVSVIYVVLLAVVDGMFNRLVFRENRKLPYGSDVKQRLYKSFEWWVIGILFLLVLPVVIPSILAYVYGGIVYLTVYWIILLLVQWDVIFGKIVFDNWWGDTPSIALPFVGWVQLPLRLVILGRVLLAGLLANWLLIK